MKIRAWIFRHRWTILTIWVITFSAVVILGIISLRDLIHDTGQSNRDRINDIQVSRISSCKNNYEAFLTVFKPFFPPPKKRNAKQRRDWSKLNNVVNKKKSQCPSQVR